MKALSAVELGDAVEAELGQFLGRDGAFGELGRGFGEGPRERIGGSCRGAGGDGGSARQPGAAGQAIKTHGDQHTCIC